MKYNPDIHHRRSVRLQKFDYASQGSYFITICAQGKECLFGVITDGVMELNNAGRMVTAVWNDLTGRFPHVALDQSIVMPNHLHGILLLTRADAGEHKVRPYGDKYPCGTPAGSVGRVVQAFKSLTTHAYIDGVRENNWQPFNGKLWQRNYFEHIIRDENELHRIREYITGNPLKWESDNENLFNPNS